MNQWNLAVSLHSQPMKSCIWLWGYQAQPLKFHSVFFMNSVSKSQIFIWKSDIADLEVEDGPTQKFLKIECFE